MRDLSNLLYPAALFGMVAIAGVASAETAEGQALEAGARRLASDEIAARIVDKTLTFSTGEKTLLVHYGADNVVSGKSVEGAWSDTGYYGITNDDRVCLSWSKSDEGRLRCWTVLLAEDVLKKFNPDGSLAGDVVRFQDGKAF